MFGSVSVFLRDEKDLDLQILSAFYGIFKGILECILCAIYMLKSKGRMEIINPALMIYALLFLIPSKITIDIGLDANYIVLLVTFVLSFFIMKLKSYPNIETDNKEGLIDEEDFE